MTVSGSGLPALPAVFVATLITIRCFRMSAPKAGNGFVAQRIVSSPAARRNNGPKDSMISVECSQWIGDSGQPPALSFTAPAAIAPWLTSAISSAAGPGTGVRLFNASRVKKAARWRNELEPKTRRDRLTRTTCNLPGCLRVVTKISAGEAVMDNRTTDVGSKIASRKPGGHIIERVTGTNGSPDLRIDAPNTVRLQRPGICGAMSQQCGDSGNVFVSAKTRPVGGLPRPQGPAPGLGAPWPREAIALGILRSDPVT